MTLPTPVLVPAQLRAMADLIEQDNPAGWGGSLLGQGDLAAPGCVEFSTERATYILGPTGAIISEITHGIDDDDFCPQCGEACCCEDTHGP